MVTDNLHKYVKIEDLFNKITEAEKEIINSSGDFNEGTCYGLEKAMLIALRCNLIEINKDNAND